MLNQPNNRVHRIRRGGPVMLNVGGYASGIVGLL